MISVHGLVKTFGQTRALRDVHLEVARGECLGVVGARGSGRSTLIRVLATLVAPTAGAIIIDGVDAVADGFSARSRLFWVSDRVRSGGELLVREYARLMGEARPSATRAAYRTTAGEVLARAGVAPDSFVGALSAAEYARLTLALAMTAAPCALLLDEPFVAMDARWRDECESWLRPLRDAGTAIVVTMSDADQATDCCDRIEHLVEGGLVGPVPPKPRSRDARSTPS